uniref:NADH dehydrogenase subunit 4L n=1 Tax=Scurria scurra TaxID=351200 RepID=UPI001EDE44A2|nr:NADH dehydrogenase subunit 4L [Scurria scurra]UHY95075.1 NADH dehydrogenase subunit 4L [Scurria scurra]
MTLSISFLGLFVFLSGAISLTRQKTSFLSVLLGLEMCNVGVFLTLSAGLSVGTISPGILLFFFVLCVCEAGIGLAVLVVLARCHGHDHISTVGTLTHPI